MEPYQQRMVDEKHDLDVKIEKLTAFIDDVKFFKLHPHERMLRLTQRRAMGEYSNALAELIARFDMETVV